REALVKILEPMGMDVITAPTPGIAQRKIQTEKPEVIILDLEMPEMDGVEFLRQKLNREIPVVIFSGFASGEKGMKAMENGAVEAIQKPAQSPGEAKILIYDAVRAAAQAKRKTVAISTHGTVSPTVIINKESTRPGTAGRSMQIVVAGASTGGTQALEVLLTALPADAPPIVVVQHMPAGFTTQFAKRLNGLCRVSVKEGEDGDRVHPGHVVIAPGNKHLLLKKTGAQYRVEIKEGPLVSRHRPSVDVLFRSASRYAGSNAVGVLLTGMGKDGAEGMKDMHDAGAYTIAQDEATSVVFGMPNEAIRLGGVDEILPLQKIEGRIQELCVSKK
ncbi:MAG: chemotaxis response regulator protein-glutamate methylesterase, partial [bacterium]|nr:chemotaxis response regulator protein-glutamate methylesterase [bacterium]